MLTFEERRQLEEMMEGVTESTRNPSSLDVSNRFRDERGRFLSNPPAPEVSRSRSVEQVRMKWKLREIKVKRVPGSYGTFRVKTKWLTTEEKTYLYCFFGFIALAIAI
jgi:hypothetical protein